MADELCLLNLDTGDFMTLGERVGSGEGLPKGEYRGVPETGYLDNHPLIVALPLIYDEDLDGPHSDGILDIRKRRGHALNTFLAASLGCRMIVLRQQYLFAIIDDAAREHFDFPDGAGTEMIGYLRKLKLGQSLSMMMENQFLKAPFFTKTALPEAAGLKFQKRKPSVKGIGKKLTTMKMRLSLHWPRISYGS